MIRRQQKWRWSIYLKGASGSSPPPSRNRAATVSKAGEHEPQMPSQEDTSSVGGCWKGRTPRGFVYEKMASGVS